MTSLCLTTRHSGCTTCWFFAFFYVTPETRQDRSGIYPDGVYLIWENSETGKASFSNQEILNFFGFNSVIIWLRQPVSLLHLRSGALSFETNASGSNFFNTNKTLFLFFMNLESSFSLAICIFGKEHSEDRGLSKNFRKLTLTTLQGEGCQRSAFRRCIDIISIYTCKANTILFDNIRHGYYRRTTPRETGHFDLWCFSS